MLLVPHRDTCWLKNVVNVLNNFIWDYSLSVSWGFLQSGAITGLSLWQFYINKGCYSIGWYDSMSGEHRQRGKSTEGSQSGNTPTGVCLPYVVGCVSLKVSQTTLQSSRIAQGRVPTTRHWQTAQTQLRQGTRLSWGTDRQTEGWGNLPFSQAHATSLCLSARLALRNHLHPIYIPGMFLRPAWMYPVSITNCNLWFQGFFFTVLHLLTYPYSFVK